MTLNSLKTARERKERGGKRGEKEKKRTPGTHSFYIAYYILFFYGFLKRCFLKICPFSPEAHRN